ncbi:cytochrome P450 [Thozetella sp. PMI_491]|nr:cytochrome P450 [Thozetella sp. PMI_491]
MFWGHLKLMGEYAKKVPAGTHAQTVFTLIKQDFDLPDVFYLDLWPLGPRFLVCTTPDSCAISTTINNFEQPHFVTSFFDGTMGTGFIEATNGSLWKHLHMMLAPGFTPNSVKGYHAMVIKEAAAFHGRLRNTAKAGKVVNMRRELGQYPFQVIGIIFFGQILSHDVYEEALLAVDVQTKINATNNPLTKRSLRKELAGCFRRIEAILEPTIRSRYATLQQQKVTPKMAEAATVLDRMLITQIENGQPLDAPSIRLIHDNLNGFLVAGFGTTTDTSNYIFMLLSAHPEALKKMREEHDRVFSKDFDKTVEMLQQDPSLLRQLDYTKAVIDETLRLFPIGFSVRAVPSDMTTVEYKGKQYPVKDHNMAVLSLAMHYSPDYFDEPKKFIPERFLGNELPCPRNAYRPFERGVRSCLGQALALDEMKIMLVLVARWFDFELRDCDLAEKPRYTYTDMDTVIGRHGLQLFSFSATPNGPVDTMVTAAR